MAAAASSHRVGRARRSAPRGRCSAARRSAMARPMPLAAPVTSATCRRQLALGLLQLGQLQRPVLELDGVGLVQEAEAAQRLGRLHHPHRRGGSRGCPPRRWPCPSSPSPGPGRAARTTRGTGSSISAAGPVAREGRPVLGGEAIQRGRRARGAASAGGAAGRDRAGDEQRHWRPQRRMCSGVDIPRAASAGARGSPAKASASGESSWCRISGRLRRQAGAQHRQQPARRRPGARAARRGAVTAAKRRRAAPVAAAPRRDRRRRPRPG